MLSMLMLGGAIVTGPQGNQYIQPTGNGYNVWSTNGLTTVRDYNGWEQIRTPDGSTTNIIETVPGGAPNLEPVLGPVMGPEINGE